MSKMIVPNSQQKIEIYLGPHVKGVGLKISGGADSAIVGYMLSKYVKEYRPDIKIYPITVNHEGKAYQEQYAKGIVEYYKSVFGDIYGKHYIDRNMTSDTYVSVQQELVDSLYPKDIIQAHFVGITKNPPKEVMDTLMKGHGGPADDRNIQDGLKPTTRHNHIYFPLINIDKKGVKELYDYFGVLDTLFPITRSCESFTEDFTSHCETGCWFCLERYWGFGRYV